MRGRSPRSSESPLPRRRFLQRTARVALAGSALAASGNGLVADTSGRLRIGQIGVRHAHASGKLRVYRASRDFEVVGVVEPDDAAWERVRASDAYRGVPRLSLEQLLLTPKLRAVAVETEVSSLLHYAQVCVEAGLHVHLDKPAGSDLPSFRELLATADRKKLTVQLGYMYRYSPAVRFLRSVLRQGWLGEPFEVHAVMSKVVGNDDRAVLATAPGGMMFELGCHITDLVVQVLGRPDSVTPFLPGYGVAADGLQDNMLAVLRYSRALATVKSTALEVEGFARRHLVVCGTEGTLHIEPLDAPAVRFAMARPRGTYAKGYQDIPFGEYQRYVGDAVDLAKIVRGEKAADFSSSHDLAVQETVLRACGLPVD